VSAQRRRSFPLVSRHRMTGVAYGSQRSLRRGQGAEIAGSRGYVPGDRLAWIDWYASARLSLSRDDDLFVVRQYYEEVAPRVIIVVDRRPSMGLYPPEFPWLCKPLVLREAITAIVAAAHAARAYVGYLDFVGESNGSGSSAYWISPHRQSARKIVERISEGFSAPSDSFELAIDYLLSLRSDVPAGSFVFILSDFLCPLPDHVWSRARERGWDVAPVIIQDRVWEQNFPGIEGLLVPFTDSRSGKSTSVRLTAREARERQSINVARLRNTIDGFRRLKFDSILLDTSNTHEIDSAFIRWATKRRLSRAVAR